MAKLTSDIRVISRQTAGRNSLLVIKLPLSYKATAANINDSEVIEYLLNRKEDGDQPLYADSAYRSEAIEQVCLKKDIISCIHEKG